MVLFEYTCDNDRKLRILKRLFDCYNRSDDGTQNIGVKTAKMRERLPERYYQSLIITNVIIKFVR